MNLSQIKKAIAEGTTVYWSSTLYTVILDSKGQYLIKCNDAGQHCIGLTWKDGVTLNGNEWQFFTDQIMTVAKEFCKLLRESYLTNEEIALANKRNAIESDPRVCHTADFIDTNDAMLQAFENAGLTETTPASVTAEFIEKNSDLWNAAWNLAKNNQFKL